MLPQSRLGKFVRRVVLPFMVVVMLLQPLGVSAASAEIYGYHDDPYPTWTKFTANPRVGNGSLLRFDQWSGNPMYIGYGYCYASTPIIAQYSTVSGWANIGYPTGTFCLFTRPANSSLPYGSSYPFTGVIEW